MGEIGLDRKEYLYELEYWEIILISRGYQRRHHPGWEQARLVAYHARYCMGSKTTPPPVSEWLPFPWETISDLPTDEEINRIREQIKEENRRREANNTNAE